MTLDGFCDHTSVDPDAAIHQHYAALLSNAGAILYGRVTYQLMEYWRSLILNPSGEKSMDDFAQVMDKIPKIVFSRTLQSVDWHSARLATRNFEDEVIALKSETGKDIFVGSPGLIMSLWDLELIDEFQLCIHPVIAGKGTPLFKNLNSKISLELFKTKVFKGGAVVLYYKLK